MIVECPACHSRYDVGGRPPGTRARCRCGNTFHVPERSRSAGALECPICGAPAAPNESRCSHCQTALAVVGCPRCFGRVFQGSAHCSHCGAEVSGAASALPAAESRRLCPRCAPNPQPLLANEVESAVLDECHGCGGVWMDGDVFGRVVRDREQHATFIQWGGPRLELQEPASVSGTPSPLRYLPCPDCGELMHRQNFGRRSGIILDVCRRHGLWFDRDELSRALRFAMEGRLEESRRLELEQAERQLELRKHELGSPALPGPHETWISGFSLDVLLSVFRSLFL